MQKFMFWFVVVTLPILFAITESVIAAVMAEMFIAAVVYGLLRGGAWLFRETPYPKA